MKTYLVHALSCGLAAMTALGCAAEMPTTEAPTQSQSVSMRRKIPFTERHFWSTSIDAAPGIRFSERAPRALQVSVSDGILRGCEDFDISAPQFEFDSSRLSRDDHPELRALAQCLTEGSLRRRNVHLVGNTDPRGGMDENLILGERRAESVKDFLTTHGVSSARILITSRGEIGAVGRDSSSWSDDRRVDILLAGEPTPE